MKIYTLNTYNELTRGLSTILVTPFHVQAKMLMQNQIAKLCEEYSGEIYTVERVGADNVNVVLLGDKKIIIKLETHEI